MSTARARFMTNNFLTPNNSGIIDFSSAETGFPGTNLLETDRNLPWIATGEVIDFTQKTGTSKDVTININDGSNKAIIIDATVLYTPTTLAAAVEAEMNNLSSGWTVTYNSSDKTYNINNSTPTYTVASSSNQISGAMGLYEIDSNGNRQVLTGTVVGANGVTGNRTIHYVEYVRINLGVSQTFNFAALIFDANEPMPLSDSAKVTLMANNHGQFVPHVLDNISIDTQALIEVRMTRTDTGYYAFVPPETQDSYRYWAIQIFDPNNPKNSSDIKYGHAYIGDYLELTGTNIGTGFSREFVDPSRVLESETGNRFFDLRTKRAHFNSVSIGLVPRILRDQIDQISFDHGVSRPFYLSMDPDTNVSTNIDDLTRFVYFNSPVFNQHVIRDLYTVQFDLRESV